MAERPPNPGPSDAQRIIDDQAREIERLREDLRRSEAERQRLRRENERLREDLEAARRTAHRLAAPFSRGVPKRDPARPGRKAGGAYGQRGHRRVPSRIDETYEAPLPGQCPSCRGALRRTAIVAQYQEELPVQRPLVRCFRIHVGRCTQCRRRVQGRHRLQTSDALGAAAVHLGPEAVALAVLLNKQGGLSYGKLAQLFQARWGLTVTRSGVVQAVHRAAQRAQPTYHTLCATVRGSPVVAADETSWKVGGFLHWLWTFVTPTTTIYQIHEGRGFAQAATALGPAYAGVLVRDGWAPYRQFRHALHQTCLAHLFRRCRTLQLDYPRHPLAADVAALLHAALRTRDRARAGRLSPHGLAVARGQFMSRLGRVLGRRPSRLEAVRRFATHLITEYDAVFSFLFDLSVDATNWRAEQALRPAVVTRKMCGGGSRTARGAHSQQILMSVLRTSQQRGLDVTALLTTLLRAPQAVVGDAFITTLR